MDSRQFRVPDLAGRAVLSTLGRGDALHHGGRRCRRPVVRGVRQMADVGPVELAAATRWSDAVCHGASGALEVHVAATCAAWRTVASDRGVFFECRALPRGAHAATLGIDADVRRVGRKPGANPDSCATKWSQPTLVFVPQQQVVADRSASFMIQSYCRADRGKLVVVGFKVGVMGRSKC
jgi:hypothetical protein